MLRLEMVVYLLVQITSPLVMMAKKGIEESLCASMKKRVNLSGNLLSPNLGLEK